jgi:hypothetical protein
LCSPPRPSPRRRRPTTSGCGWRIAYSPDIDVFPVEPEVAGVVADAVRAFEEAGAQVEQVRLGIEHDQRELSDLWCRLIIPINIAGFENFKRNGLDLLADHRDDFPPEYLRWIDEGYELRVPQLMRDEEVRTEIYDAIQGVLDEFDLLVTPTLACLPVENAGDGNTRGPSAIGGVEVDPLIGWCRKALRGRRRTRGGRRLRARAPLEGHIPGNAGGLRSPRQVTLRADGVGLGEPVGDLVVDLGGALDPERVQVVARREGLDAAEARLLASAGEHDVAVDPALPRLQRGEAHPGVERDARLLGEHVERAVALGDLDQPLDDRPDLRGLAGEVIVERTQRCAGVGLVAGREPAPAVRARPHFHDHGS